MPLSLKVNSKHTYVIGTYLPTGERFKIIVGDTNYSSAQLLFEEIEKYLRLIEQQ